MPTKRRQRLKQPVVSIHTKYPADLFADMQVLAEADNIHIAEVIRAAVIRYLDLAPIRRKIIKCRTQQPDQPDPADAKTPQP